MARLAGLFLGILGCLIFARVIFIIFFCTLHSSAFCQWNLEVSSRVEKDGKGLSGASVALYQGSTLIKETTSRSDGDFTMDVPANGEYLIEVSYQDCNKKKFLVSTRGVPAEVAADNFMPRYRIGGFTMNPPLYSIDYSALRQPLLKVVYFNSSGKFDHDAAYTERMLTSLGQIRDAEKALLDKHEKLVKEADNLLKKKNCEQARQTYQQAIALIPQSPYQDYPQAQLAKCDDCLKSKTAPAATPTPGPAHQAPLSKTQPNGSAPAATKSAVSKTVPVEQKKPNAAENTARSKAPEENKQKEVASRLKMQDAKKEKQPAKETKFQQEPAAPKTSGKKKGSSKARHSIPRTL